MVSFWETSAMLANGCQNFVAVCDCTLVLLSIRPHGNTFLPCLGFAHTKKCCGDYPAFGSVATEKIHIAGYYMSSSRGHRTPAVVAGFTAIIEVGHGRRREKSEPGLWVRPELLEGSDFPA